jgi:prevent-host-death family protein
MNRAVEHNERFVVSRRGEPAVVIMSIKDYVQTFAPPPKWLEKAWAGAKKRGVDKLTLAEINAEIKAARSEKKKPAQP